MNPVVHIFPDLHVSRLMALVKFRSNFVRAWTTSRSRGPLAVNRTIHPRLFWWLATWQSIESVNTLRPRQHGRHFADDTFKRIFLNENVRISIKISLKFVPKGPINNIPYWVKMMAWRRPGDKPLSETMTVRLPTHICVTRPQSVNPCLIYFILITIKRLSYNVNCDVPVMWR